MVDSIEVHVSASFLMTSTGAVQFSNKNEENKILSTVDWFLSKRSSHAFYQSDIRRTRKLHFDYEVEQHGLLSHRS